MSAAEQRGGRVPVRVRMEAARDLDQPLPEGATPTDIVRRRFFAGESLNNVETQNELGVSEAFMSATVSNMRTLGYEFEREPVEYNGLECSTYRLLNPDHEPDWDNPLPKRGKKPKKAGRKPRKAEPSPRAARQPRYEPPPTSPPLPPLGTFVEVSFLALADDGGLRVGVRHEERTWLLRLEGSTD